MIPIQPWEARAGVSGDSTNFLRHWMNHNPSISRRVMILSIHIMDVTYTFYLEALHMIHYHDTDR